MAMTAISDDLDVMFETGVFAVEAAISIAATSGEVVVRGIFDREDMPVVADLTERFDAYVKVTKFTCKSSDVPNIAVNDVVEVEGGTYYVAHTPIDDGQGVVELILAAEAV